MFEQIFLRLLENSIQASFFILAILFIRLCFPHLPKRYVCVLWAFLALRLLLPIQITSTFSLVPDTGRVQTLADAARFPEYSPQENESLKDTLPQTMPSGQQPSAIPDITAPAAPTDIFDIGGAAAPPDTVQQPLGSRPQPTVTTAYPVSGTSLFTLLSYIWLGGLVLFVAYGIFSYLHTKHRLREAVHDSDNIWYADNIPVPFVLGYVKPRIYIPYSIEKEALPYIIAHEKTHIIHFDYLSKLLGYLILSLYWFHPFIWGAYIYFCKDLEFSCDERVIMQLGEEKRKAYSQALLACSVSNRAILQTPLAFSELGVKERILGILHYKKPGFWGILLALIVCTLACVCFLTNPKHTEELTATEASELPDGAIEAYPVNDFPKAIAAKSHDYWCERLLGEQKISSAEVLYTYGNPYDADVSFGANKELVHTYYTMDDTFIPTMYTTTWSYKREKDQIYVYEIKHTSYENITTADEAEGLDPFYGSYFQPEDNSQDMVRLSTLVTNVFLELYNTGNGNFTECPLLQPDRALEILLHVSGGTAEILPSDGDNQKVVVYTFSDGTWLAYHMYRELAGHSTDSQGLYWFPSCVCQEEGLNELRKTQAYIEQVTPEDLEKVTTRYDYDISLYQYILPDTYSTDVFLILNEIPEKDVTLYGLCNGKGMIFQEGNSIYKVKADWMGGYSSMPDLFKYDYDNDDVEEYAIKQITGTGTGVSLEEITIFETEGDSLRMQTFDGWAIGDHYSASIKDHILTIDTGYDNCTLDLTAIEHDNKCTYKSVGVGDLISFEEIDGQWWIYAKVGLISDSVVPNYPIEITLAAPVTYYNDKYFEIGNVSILVDATDSYGQYSSIEDQQDFHGFMLTSEDGSSDTEYRYEYFDQEEDVTILINASGSYGLILHNGKRLEINTYGAFYKKDDSEYVLPYLMDVTGDGIKDLVLTYSSYPPDNPYAVETTFVYRLDTMEQVRFNTDTAELSRLLTLTPKSYNEETHELTLDAFYDESIHENLIEADRAPYEITAQIDPEMEDYWKGTHYSYIPEHYDSLSFHYWNNRFTAEYTVYLDSMMSYNRFYPFYVDYVWDESSGSFVMDLSTAYIQAAG